MALIPPQHLRLPVRRVPPDRLRRAQMQLDVLHRTGPARDPHGTRTAPARHPHGTRTTHLLTVGSPHDCRPATGDRSYGRLTIKLFQFLKGTARTS